MTGTAPGVTIPERFLEPYRDIVDDFQAFEASLKRYPRSSFRVNTLKGRPEDVVARLTIAGIKAVPVPWYADAFVTENEQVLGFTLERFLGTIYIQELASMIPPLVAAEELRGATMVLDACAAPGSKTTQAAAIMYNNGCIIANDRNYGRIRALQFNIHKFGAINAVITACELQELPRMTFDVVLLDVPCSSIGTVRKNPKLFESWQEKVSLGYSRRQMDLMLRGFDMLRPGGTLVYSTCSLSPDENEVVIDYLLRKRTATVISVAVPGFQMAPGITRWRGAELNPEVARTGRVWPHLNDTDGFFVAKVRK